MFIALAWILCLFCNGAGWWSVQGLLLNAVLSRLLSETTIIFHIWSSTTVWGDVMNYWMFSVCKRKTSIPPVVSPWCVEAAESHVHMYTEHSLWLFSHLCARVCLCLSVCVCVCVCVCNHKGVLYVRRMQAAVSGGDDPLRVVALTLTIIFPLAADP